jgi:hypothetical protein
LTVSPSTQETLAPPTPRDARPSWIPPRVTVVPRTSTSLPSPDRDTVHDVPLHENEFEVKEQALSGSSATPPARAPAASRTARVVVEGMPRG